MRNGITRFVPGIAMIAGYDRSWLRFDLAAGFIASAVVLPKAMAYAGIAGLPIAAGLYTALAAMAIYPFFGTSRVLSVSTTSTIALMTAAGVASLNQDAAVASAPMAVATTLALLVGVFLIMARVLRLGFIANFISKPVLIGFEAGIGVVIAVSQLKSIVGIHITSKTTVGTLRELPAMLPQAHWPTMAVALAGIALLLVLPRVLPRVPAPLVLVGISAFVVWLFGLESSGIQLVGALPQGLPALTWPDLSLVSRLWPAGLGIALMSFTESVASARTFLRRDAPAISPDQELIAVGAANIGAGFFGGFPAGGGASQTAVNSRAGAQSQAAQFVCAGVAAVCLVFLSKAVGFLPQAALAALVFVVAVSMIKPEKFRAIRQIRTDELWWALATMAGVIIIGTLGGILIAVGISILTLLYQANHPPVYAVAYNRQKGIFRRAGEHEGDETFPGLLVLRTEGRLTFANAANAGEKMWALVEQVNPRVIVLECSAIPDMEYTALEMLTDAQEKLRQQGVELWLAALNPDLLQIIERSPLGKALGHERMFFNVFKAVEAYKAGEGKNAA